MFLRRPISEMVSSVQFVDFILFYPSPHPSLLSVHKFYFNVVHSFIICRLLLFWMRARIIFVGAKILFYHEGWFGLERIWCWKNYGKEHHKNKMVGLPDSNFIFISISFFSLKNWVWRKIICYFVPSFNTPLDCQ